MVYFMNRKISINPKGNFIIFSITLSLLLNTYCSRKFYQDQSFPNLETRAEERRLKAFMDAGTGKPVNAHTACVNEIIETARQYLDVPHCMGGRTMKCMDCSGLLVTVFAKHGIHLPHNSEEQARFGKIMKGTDDLITGDLVFFIRSYKTHRFITHSGIYIGNNSFIHTSSRNGVTITSLSDPWWNGKFIFATRLFD